MLKELGNSQTTAKPVELVIASLFQEKLMLEETIAEYEDSYFFDGESEDYIMCVNRLDEVEKSLNKFRKGVK